MIFEKKWLLKKNQGDFFSHFKCFKWFFFINDFFSNNTSLDVAFQLTNSLRVCFVDPILQVAPQEKIGGAEIRTVWGPFEVCLSTDDSVVFLPFPEVWTNCGADAFERRRFVVRCSMMYENCLQVVHSPWWMPVNKT